MGQTIRCALGKPPRKQSWVSVFLSSGATVISLGCITASLSHNLRRGSALVCVSLKISRNPPSAIRLSWISFGWKEDISSLSYYFSLIPFNITAWMLSSECSPSLNKANVLCFQHLSLSANVLPFFLHSANGTLYTSAYILWSTLSPLILWASESDLKLLSSYVHLTLILLESSESTQRELWK